MGELMPLVVFVGGSVEFSDYLEGLSYAGTPIGVSDGGKSVTSLTHRYVRYTGEACLRGMTGPAELVIGHDATGAQVEQAREQLRIVNLTQPTAATAARLESPRSINVYVQGRPAPQGSKRISPTGAMREQSPYLVAWAGGWKGTARLGKRQHGAVERAIYRWYQERGVHPAELIGGYVKGPVVVTIRFYLDPAHGPIDGPPDVDKLARATFDALTAASAWADDGRVVEAHLSKRPAIEGRPSGAYIIIEEATL